MTSNNYMRINFKKVIASNPIYKGTKKPTIMYLYFYIHKSLTPIIHPWFRSIFKDEYVEDLCTNWITSHNNFERVVNKIYNNIDKRDRLRVWEQDSVWPTKSGIYVHNILMTLYPDSMFSYANVSECTHMENVSAYCITSESMHKVLTKLYEDNKYYAETKEIIFKE